MSDSLDVDTVCYVAWHGRHKRVVCMDADSHISNNDKIHDNCWLTEPPQSYIAIYI